MEWKKAVKYLGRKLLYFNPDIDIERTGWNRLYKFLHENTQDKKDLPKMSGPYISFMGPTRIAYQVYLDKKIGGDENAKTNNDTDRTD